MILNILPMNETNAHAIACWRYVAPYDFYNWNPDETGSYVKNFLNPQNACYSIMDEQGNLAGFCSFGPDGQVAGGDYGREALDIGMGIHPDLTGRGNGMQYGQQVLDFACRTFAPGWFRVTIAAFNQRAQHIWQKLNFKPVQQFVRAQDCTTFIILVRKPDQTIIINA